MSAESVNFIPESQRERHDHFYLRLVVQSALTKEWVKLNPGKKEDEWFELYNDSFRACFPGKSEDPVVQAESERAIAECVNLLQTATPEQVSIKLAEIQTKLSASKTVS